MTNLQPFSIEAKQRAERFATLIKEFRQQAVHPIFQTAGIEVPPLSKRKLAQLMGVSPTLINKYENAEIDPWDVRLGLILKFAQLSGVDIAELQDYLLSGRPKITLKLVALSDEQRLSA